MEVRALVIAGALLSLAAPASAQQMSSPADVWEQFYSGCAENPANSYLCACAATEFVSRCQAQGARSPVQIGQCIQREQNAWIQPVTTACQNRSHLRLGGPVRTPRAQPISPGGGPTMSRGDVWDAAYEGCGRQIGRSGVTHYGCACVATYAADACAVQASVPAAHVERCIRAAQPGMVQVAPSCQQFGALVAGGAATPSAAQAPPGIARPARVNARAACRGASDSGRGAVAFCQRVVNAVAANDTDGFAALATGGVEVGGQSFAGPLQLGLFLERQGGVWSYMTRGVSGFMRGGPFRAMVEDQSGASVLIDMNATGGTGATVTIIENGGRWEMAGLSVP